MAIETLSAAGLQSTTLWGLYGLITILYRVLIPIYINLKQFFQQVNSDFNFKEFYENVYLIYSISKFCAESFNFAPEKKDDILSSVDVIIVLIVHLHSKAKKKSNDVLEKTYRRKDEKPLARPYIFSLSLLV